MNSKEFFKAEISEDKNEKSDKVKKEASKTEIEGEVFKDKIEMVKNINKNPENFETVMRCNDKTSWSIAKAEITKHILDEVGKDQKNKENEGYSDNQGKI